MHYLIVKPMHTKLRRSTTIPKVIAKVEATVEDSDALDESDACDERRPYMDLSKYEPTARPHKDVNSPMAKFTTTLESL